MLDLALLLLYAVYLPVYITKLDYRAAMVTWVNVVQYGWVAVVMAVSTVARYPWALQHAKEASPQVAWSSLTFRSVVDQVAWAWAGGMLLASLLAVVPGVLGRVKMDPLNIVFNYVWPYVTLVTLLAATRFWPSVIRNRYYLPKLHQGSVEPGADGAAAAGGDGTGTGTAAGGQPGQVGEGGALLAPGQPGTPQLLLGPDGVPLPQQQQLPPGTPGTYPPTPGTFPPTPSSPLPASLGASFSAPQFQPQFTPQPQQSASYPQNAFPSPQQPPAGSAAFPSPSAFPPAGPPPPYGTAPAYPGPPPR